MHKSPTGSSLAYLKKNLKDEHGFENGVALLKALKKAVADGRLEQPTKSSYSIPGLAFAPPADETVEIKDTKVVGRIVMSSIFLMIPISAVCAVPHC
jgi:hypothetical protein